MALFDVEVTLRVRVVADNPGEAAVNMERALMSALDKATNRTLYMAKLKSAVAYPALISGRST